MKTYTARCEFDETRWWAVSVPEVPGAFTQCRRLDQVEDNLAEVLKLMTGEDRTRYELHFDVHFSERADKLAGIAREIRSEVEHLTRELQSATRAAAIEIHEGGANYRDVGWMLGIAHQRAHQLVKAATRVDAAHEERAANKPT